MHLTYIRLFNPRNYNLQYYHCPYVADNEAQASNLPKVTVSGLWFQFRQLGSMTCAPNHSTIYTTFWTTHLK